MPVYGTDYSSLYGGGFSSGLSYSSFLLLGRTGGSGSAGAGYSSSGGYSSGNYYGSSARTRYSPLLPTILESGLSPTIGRRALRPSPVSYTPPSVYSPRTTPAAYHAPKPVRVDTENIDVSTPRKQIERKPESETVNIGESSVPRSTIKRGRTVVRIHTKQQKENPYIAEERRIKNKMTPGEKLKEKFLIKECSDKERRRRIEEDLKLRELEREEAEKRFRRLMLMDIPKSEVAPVKPEVSTVTEDLIGTHDSEDESSDTESSTDSQASVKKKKRRKTLIRQLSITRKPSVKEPPTRGRRKSNASDTEDKFAETRKDTVKRKMSERLDSIKGGVTKKKVAKNCIKTCSENKLIPVITSVTLDSIQHSGSVKLSVDKLDIEETIVIKSPPKTKKVIEGSIKRLTLNRLRENTVKQRKQETVLEQTTKDRAEIQQERGEIKREKTIKKAPGVKKESKKVNKEKSPASTDSDSSVEWIWPDDDDDMWIKPRLFPHLRTSGPDPQDIATALQRQNTVKMAKKRSTKKKVKKIPEPLDLTEISNLQAANIKTTVDDNKKETSQVTTETKPLVNETKMKATAIDTSPKQELLKDKKCDDMKKADKKSESKLTEKEPKVLVKSLTVKRRKEPTEKSPNIEKTEGNKKQADECSSKEISDKSPIAESLDKKIPQAKSQQLDTTVTEPEVKEQTEISAKTETPLDDRLSKINLWLQQSSKAADSSKKGGDKIQINKKDAVDDKSPKSNAFLKQKAIPGVQDKEMPVKRPTLKHLSSINKRSKDDMMFKRSIRKSVRAKSESSDDEIDDIWGDNSDEYINFTELYLLRKERAINEMIPEESAKEVTKSEDIKTASSTDAKKSTADPTKSPAESKKSTVEPEKSSNKKDASPTEKIKKKITDFSSPKPEIKQVKEKDVKEAAKSPKQDALVENKDIKSETKLETKTDSSRMEDKKSPENNSAESPSKSKTDLKETSSDRKKIELDEKLSKINALFSNTTVKADESTKPDKILRVATETDLKPKSPLKQEKKLHEKVAVESTAKETKNAVQEEKKDKITPSKIGAVQKAKDKITDSSNLVTPETKEESSKLDDAKKTNAVDDKLSKINAWLNSTAEKTVESKIEIAKLSDKTAKQTVAKKNEIVKLADKTQEQTVTKKSDIDDKLSKINAWLTPAPAKLEPKSETEKLPVEKEKKVEEKKSELDDKLSKINSWLTPAKAVEPKTEKSEKLTEPKTEAIEEKQPVKKSEIDDKLSKINAWLNPAPIEKKVETAKVNEKKEEKTPAKNTELDDKLSKINAWLTPAKPADPEPEKTPADKSKQNELDDKLSKINSWLAATPKTPVELPTQEDKKNKQEKAENKQKIETKAEQKNIDDKLSRINAWLGSSKVNETPKPPEKDTASSPASEIDKPTEESKNKEPETVKMKTQAEIDLEEKLKKINAFLTPSSATTPQQPKTTPDTEEKVTDKSSQAPVPETKQKEIDDKISKINAWLAPKPKPLATINAEKKNVEEVKESKKAQEEEQKNKNDVAKVETAMCQRSATVKQKKTETKTVFEKKVEAPVKTDETNDSKNIEAEKSSVKKKKPASPPAAIEKMETVNKDGSSPSPPNSPVKSPGAKKKTEAETKKSLSKKENDPPVSKELITEEKPPLSSPKDKAKPPQKVQDKKVPLKRSLQNKPPPKPAQKKHNFPPPPGPLFKSPLIANLQAIMLNKNAPLQRFKTPIPPAEVRDGPPKLPKDDTPPPEPQIKREERESTRKMIFIPDRVSTVRHQALKSPQQSMEQPEVEEEVEDEEEEDSDTDTESGEESSSSGSDTETEDGQQSKPDRTSTSSEDSGFGSTHTSPLTNKNANTSGVDREGISPNHPARRLSTSLSSDSESGEEGSGARRYTPPARTIPRFRKYTVDDFQFLKVLGKGSFGKVLLAELRSTDCYYAVKCLKKDVVLEDDDVECTLIERKVLALGTRHPYLCHLFCTFQTESHLFFVMEYLNGGDLMFHIQQSGRFEQPRAAFYAAEIVSGLKFLHKKGIVYRDLKLDNILLDYEGHVRIADFGMCKLQIYLDRTADTFCGTPDYMAPEIIKGMHYNQCVDWWSFGVLLYEMLIGQSPFNGCDEDELFWSICNEQPYYPRFLSKDAHSILQLLLEKDSSRRLGTPDCPAGDVYMQPFFKSIDWQALERKDLEPPFKPRVLHALDVQYFDSAFTQEAARLTPVDKEILQSMDQSQFHGFSYTNPNACNE